MACNQLSWAKGFQPPDVGKENKNVRLGNAFTEQKRANA